MRLRDALARITAALTWVALIGILAVMVPSWLGLTLSNWHAGLQLVTPWYALVASGALLVAVVLGRRALAVVSGLLVVALLVPVVPLAWPRSAPRADGPTFSLYGANLRYNNTTIDDATRQAATSGADVVVLVELTPEGVRGMADAGADGTYPYQLLDPSTGAWGAGIYSKLPLTDEQLDRVPGLHAPSARMSVDGNPVLVVAVHTWAPLLSASVGAWSDQLDGLRHFVGEADQATVLAGDFNASRWQPGFAAIIDQSGVSDAHEDLGLGLTTSWPAGGRLGFIGPIARLDHAVVHGLTPIHIDDLPARGSDHRPFLVELAVPV